LLLLLKNFSAANPDDARLVLLFLFYAIIDGCSIVVLMLVVAVYSLLNLLYFDPEFPVTILNLASCIE